LPEHRRLHYYAVRGNVGRRPFSAEHLPRPLSELKRMRAGNRP
jgi:hypothetical protein